MFPKLISVGSLATKPILYNILRLDIKFLSIKYFYIFVCIFCLYFFVSIKYI